MVEKTKLFDVESTSYDSITAETYIEMLSIYKKLYELRAYDLSMEKNKIHDGLNDVRILWLTNEKDSFNMLKNILSDVLRSDLIPKCHSRVP